MSSTNETFSVFYRKYFDNAKCPRVAAAVFVLFGGTDNSNPRINDFNKEMRLTPLSTPIVGEPLIEESNQRLLANTLNEIRNLDSTIRDQFNINFTSVHLATAYEFRPSFNLSSVLELFFDTTTRYVIMRELAGLQLKTTSYGSSLSSKMKKNSNEITKITAIKNIVNKMISCLVEELKKLFAKLVPVIEKSSVEPLPIEETTPEISVLDEIRRELDALGITENEWD